MSSVFLWICRLKSLNYQITRPFFFKCTNPLSSYINRDHLVWWLFLCVHNSCHWMASCTSLILFRCDLRSQCSSRALSQKYPGLGYGASSWFIIIARGYRAFAPSTHLFTLGLRRLQIRNSGPLVTGILYSQSISILSCSVRRIVRVRKPLKRVMERTEVSTGPAP